MAVVLICPSCQHTRAVFREPVATQCIKCNHPLPPEVTDAVRSSLEAEAIPRPFGVTLGAGFAAVWGSVAALIILGSVLGSGPYRLNGELVAKREYLTSWPFLFIAGAAIYALATSYCVFKRRFPARRLMILPWIVAILSYFVVPLPDEATRFAGAGMGLVCLLVVLWYLYRKPNVRAYFERIEAAAPARSRS